MLPKHHIIYGAIFSLLLLSFFQISYVSAMLVFLSSFLIDFDHYLIYAIRKKDFSLKNSFNYFFNMQSKYKKEKNIKAPLSFLHTIEILFILGLASAYNKYLFFIFIGFLYHCFLDMLYMAKQGTLFIREYSLILYIKRRKKGKPRYIEYD